jgi:hypothetical protein
MNLSSRRAEPSGMHVDAKPQPEEMRAMPKRYATWAAAALAAAVAALAGAAPAAADTPGFAVKITQAPDTFTVGKDAHTLSAVVSTSSDRLQQRCVKVRWALVISTKGVSLDQIRVNRVEDGQSFPVRTQFQGDDARVIDQQVDPGQLCRDQTDTAAWTVSFTGPDNGSVNFTMQAFSQRNRALASGGASARVVTPVAAKPSDKPSTSATPSPTSTFSPEPTEAAIAPVTQASSAAPAALTKTSGSSDALLPGILVGAVLVFVGVALLMRIRKRNRQQQPAGPGWHQDTQTLPTGFYNMPHHRDQ